MGLVLRSVLAVIAGFVAASLVMMAVEALNGSLIYPELGKRAEAAKALQRALGINPGFAEAADARRRLAGLGH